MLTLLAIMMFTSLVTGGMRDSASFLDRSFSDCAFSVSSSSLGLRQPSLKDKKETFACYFTKNNMAISMCYLSHCLRSQLQFSLCLDLGCHEMPWCVIHPIPCSEFSCCCSLLLSPRVHWLPFHTQLTSRQDIPPLSPSCICKLIKDYLYSLSGTLAHIALQQPCGLVPSYTAL